MKIAYKFRLLPTKSQHATLSQILEDQRQLYNAALQERIDCYKKTGKGRSYIDQCKAVTQWRQQDDVIATIPVNLQRYTLKQVDEAYKAFFRRLKTKKGKAGFPRFKGYGRFNSFGFAEFSGIQLKNNRLHFRGLPGSLRIHFHRELPCTKILSCSFRKTTKGWYVSLNIDVETEELREPVKRVGVDLGISAFAAYSDGKVISNPRITKRYERELRKKQRALARCKKSGNNRKKAKLKLARLHTKIANTRDTFLHQVSASLVKQYDLIAIEKLNVKGLTKGFLSKEVHDVSWGTFCNYLKYKAEKAGVSLVVVNAKYTSQTCPSCGNVKAKTLSERIHHCECGCLLDRDTAAAQVILNRAVVSPRKHNVTGCGKRAFRNTNQKEF